MNVLSLCVSLVLLMVLFDVGYSSPGSQKRWFLDNWVDIIPEKFKREECILCNCFNECHAAHFHVSEKDICRNYHDFDCAHEDRCTCCNDLTLGREFEACHNGGTCHNDGGGHFSCTCPTGFDGKHCEHGASSQTTDHCAGVKCQNGGTCVNNQKGFTCNCATGWMGQDCSTPVTTIVPNSCASSPCQNGGTCSNSQNSYQCTCVQGWSGTNCGTQVTTTPAPNPCASSPCQNGGTCSNIQNSYQCTCVLGWSGTNCGTQVSTVACDHTCSLEAVVKQQYVNIITASVCPSTSTRTSNEALPMKCCSMGQPTSWQRYVKILDHCNDFPTYTPVAKYNKQALEMDNAGIFTGCLTNGDHGFQMIKQTCESPPHLVTISTTNGGDPDSYYVVY